MTDRVRIDPKIDKQGEERESQGKEKGYKYDIVGAPAVESEILNNEGKI